MKAAPLPERRLAEGHGRGWEVQSFMRTQTMHLVHPKLMLNWPDVHLRVGRHSESYSRTPSRVEVPTKPNIALVSKRPANVRIDLPATNLSSVSPRPNAQPGIPRPTIIPSIIAPAQNIAVADDEPEQCSKEQQAYHVSIAVLPSVTWIKRGDHGTRLRYAAEVLTINNDKFVKFDDMTFLYATSVGFLKSGDNVTLRQPPYRHWTSNRGGGRPQILFQLYPVGQFAYTPANGRRKKAPNEFRPEIDQYGRVLLNADDRPLKFSAVMPLKVGTEIEGWEMEAVCRLDPDVCHQDFVDRMLPDVGGGKFRPGKGTLNHRRRRDRMKMRILPWPLPRQLSYSDSQVVKELDDGEKANNSTYDLRDLTKEEIEMQCAIMYGGHFERSGANAQNDQARLQTFMANLALVRTTYAEDSEEVTLIKARISQQREKMGLQDDRCV